MQFMRTFTGVIACTILFTGPAVAGQRGHQPTVTPGTHAASPAHPTLAPKTAHPAPVAVPEKITANPALVARLTPLLPSGTTLANAAAGFKNQGQFIAALHVSHNLNIPFAQLKAEMTGADHASLGRAIQDLRPTTTNVKAAVKTAETAARADLKSTKVKADADDRR
jgi:hypothetical protein